MESCFGASEAGRAQIKSLLGVFSISLFPIAKSKSYACRHETKWWDQQDEDGPVNGMLSVFAGRGCRGVAHGATLTQRGSGPKAKQQSEDEHVSLHFTPTFSLYTKFPFLLHAQFENAVGVGKEDAHQAEAHDQGAHGQPAHARSLEFHVHEIGDDQRRLDHR
jgi:hypothetical protein